MHGIVTVHHPDIADEEKEKRYQHLVDVVVGELKKNFEVGR